MQIELSKEDIAFLISLLEQAPVKGILAMRLVLGLSAKLTMALQPQASGGKGGKNKTIKESLRETD